MPAHKKKTLRKGISHAFENIFHNCIFTQTYDKKSKLSSWYPWCGFFWSTNWKKYFMKMRTWSIRQYNTCTPKIFSWQDTKKWAVYTHHPFALFGTFNAINLIVLFQNGKFVVNSGAKSKNLLKKIVKRESVIWSSASRC